MTFQQFLKKHGAHLDRWQAIIKPAPGDRTMCLGFERKSGSAVKLLFNPPVILEELVKEHKARIHASLP